MSPYIKTILHGLGLIIHIPGFMALASLPISLLSGEGWIIGSFAATAAVSLLAGQTIRSIYRPTEKPELRQAMITAAVGWLCISIIGAIPFLAIAIQADGTPYAEATRVFRNPLNAVFESISGFTATGLTVALQPENLPHSLQWWRSFSEWVGGVGVIVLMLSVFQSTSGLHRLYYSEGREDKLLPSVTSTVRTIWWIYLLYTVLSVLLLRVTGMPWWDALNHGMTGIATGGFSINSNSMEPYDAITQAAMLPVMLLGSISFAVHFQLLSRRNLRILWQDSQHRLLIILLLLGSLALLLEYIWFSGRLTWLAPVFQWVSALSTCGFSTTGLEDWSPTAKLILLLGMITGGAAGSTVGGIKLSRLVLLYKGIEWRFQKINLRSHQLMRYTLGNTTLSEQEATRRIESAATLLALWIITLIVASVVMMHLAPSRYTAGAIVFEIASALGNVGLSLGITDPDLHWMGKLTLMLCMWMGRLEIFPVGLLISSLMISRRA